MSYNITTAEEQAIISRTFLDFCESQKSLAVRREKAFQMGKQLEVLGKKLQQDVDTVEVDDANRILRESSQHITCTLHAIAEQSDEVKRLESRMRDFGYGDMLLPSI